MEKFNSLVLQYNRQLGEFHDNTWKITKSQIAGKGIIATKHLNAGDVIFIDHPLVIGPRSVTDQQPICVGCYKSENLKPCSKGCFLSICSTPCENSDFHSFECDYLRGLRIKSENGSRSKILRVLTPLRCLTFDNVKKEIINHLHKINGPHQGLEVELLRRIVTSKIPIEDERFMRTCCSVLDANAYEVQLPHENSSIRGLYPIASVMNHSCTPNTRHDFIDGYRMIIKAATVIPAGTEITSTYAPLLLGTAARRHFLNRSKHFECKCSRCRDPTEYETYLSALRCRGPSCDSILLPCDPLNTHSLWSCQKCQFNLTPDKIAVLQNIIAQQISKLNLRCPSEIIEFVNSNRIVATTHHSIVQFKFILLKVIGYTDGYKWSELSEKLLQFKKTICNEVMKIAEKLSLGQCKILDACLFESQEIDKELNRRALRNGSENEEVHCKSALDIVENMKNENYSQMLPEL